MGIYTLAAVFNKTATCLYIVGSIPSVAGVGGACEVAHQCMMIERLLQFQAHINCRCILCGRFDVAVRRTDGQLDAVESERLARRHWGGGQSIPLFGKTTL
jgi:hypothetical protein